MWRVNGMDRDRGDATEHSTKGREGKRERGEKGGEKDWL